MVLGIVIYLVIIVLLFFGCKPNPDNPDYLSRNTGIHIRGVCCLMVLLGHLFGGVKGLSWYYADQAGACGVAVFYFLSGFGLIKSMNPTYMRGFLKRKLPKLWIPVAFLAVVYYIIYNYLIPYETDAYSGIRNLFFSSLHGDTIVCGSWYIIAISWLYLAFYGAYRYTFGRGREDWRLFICVVLIAYLIYLVRVFVEGSGFIWMYTPHMFIVGMIWSINEKKILSDKKVIGILFILALLGIIIAGFIEARSRGGHVLATIMYSSGFAFVMIFITRNLRIGNRITDFIGRNSFGIYLTHQLMIYILDRSINNVMVWLIASVVSSIVIGSAFNAALNRIYRRIGISK